LSSSVLTIQNGKKDAEEEDGMVNVELYSTIITKVSNALNMLVSGEKLEKISVSSNFKYSFLLFNYVLQHFLACL